MGFAGGLTGELAEPPASLRRPQLSDLRREAGGHNPQVWRPGWWPVSERNVMLWKGFQRPKRLEFERETLTDRFGRFYAQPFERGFGTTIGNALRRVLLSSIEGAAITAVSRSTACCTSSRRSRAWSRTRPTSSSTSSRFRSSCTSTTPRRSTLRKDKPGPVRARDIEADADVEILEPDAHIATVAEGGKLHMELRVKRGRGYVSADKNFDEDLGIGWIPIDSVHSPVKKVNYLVEARASARPPTTTS